MPRATVATRPSVPPPGDGDPLWSGRLRVQEEVGRGAMGAVLRATDTKLRRELALKVSPAPRDKLPRDQLARFIEEAQITAQLEHPNVVPVHDISVDPDGRVYFSMKLIRGRSLEAILEARRAGDEATLAEFGLRRLLDIFLHVGLALEYAHARGVVHRDLKPANIMVGDFGEVLVMDWGVAKLKGRADHPTSAAVSTEAAEPADSALDPTPSGGEVTSLRAGKKALETVTGTVLGTPAYMSPEQARGESVDERADIYALGVILYEILCGQVPFDDDDPTRTMLRTLTEKPRPPSAIDATTPLALEALALRMLEKDPERRTLTLRQIRAYIQDYVEGIGREVRRESVWRSALWVVGAIGIFAFLVWYLTGQSIAALVVLAPPAVLNAVGWFLLILAVRYPLWSAYVAFRGNRAEHDRFSSLSDQEVFVSGYLAHRTFAAALAPVFQLVFIVQIISAAVTEVTRGGVRSAEVVQEVATELRAGWAHALIVVLVFLFAHVFLLSTEVRFDRRVDRHELLVDRPAWEAVWPFFLIIVLLLTISVTDVLDWALTTQSLAPLDLLRERLLTQPLDVFEMIKTLVFQGTFLLGLVVGALLLSFPFPELLASLRMAYQPADPSFVSSRQEYFLRSLAIFRVARANWLYGGAMIGSLSAITILSGRESRPVVEQILYILGPSLVGFAGYWFTRRHALSYLSHAPAVQQVVATRVAASRERQERANLQELRAASWRSRIATLSVPVACVVGYLIWTGSGVHQQAVRELILPVTVKDWLLILPYALLVPLLLVRDQVQMLLLRRRAQPAGAVGAVADPAGTPTS